MPGKLQFAATFLPREDRLLLRGVFPDSTEIRLLLTRRLTRALLEIAERIAGDRVRADIGDPRARREVAAFAREAAVEQADAGSNIAGGTLHPAMAKGPRLVTALKATPQQGEQVALEFTLDEGEQVSLAIGATHLFGLAHLIGKQAEAADWGLPATADPGGTRPAGRRVN